MKSSALFPRVRVALLASGILWAGAASTSAEDWEQLVRTQGEHIESLQRHLEGLQKRQDETERRVDRLETLQKEVARLTDLMSELHQDVREIRSEVRGLQDELIDYRGRYRSWARANAVGERFPELRGSNGKIYKEVVIRKVTEVGLEVRHSGGTARIQHHELPAALADRFQFSVTDAQEVLAVEAERARANERLAVLALRAEEERRADAARDERIRKLEEQLASNRSVAVAASTSPFGARSRLGETRAFGTGYIWRYRYPYCRSRPTIYYPARSYGYRGGYRTTTSVPRGGRVTGGSGRVVRGGGPRIPPRPTATRVCPGGRD